MKIYWTRRSIPELAGLPPALRYKNFKDAYAAISTHIEYWAGAGIALLWVVFLFRVYGYFLPGDSTLAGSIVRTLCVLYPGMIIWDQFSIYGMRKHYRHILERGKNRDNESDSERLIHEADIAEYEQWRPVRRVICILLIVAGLVFVAATVIAAL